MKLTWYGHSTFRVEIADSVVLIDPFLKGNPSFEDSGINWISAVADTTHIALTHGHDDHLGDTVEIASINQAVVFAAYELALFLGSKGVKKLEPMGQGGRVNTEFFSLALTHAQHSSSSNGAYLGTACGVILEEHGGTTLYHMGDTDAFSDMKLIQTLYKPDIGIVPIGDRFTMGAQTAAYACKEFFDFKKVIPCHFGTFQNLDQNADVFVSHMDGRNVVIPQLGVAVDL
ncbi:MAG: metal-dependent hydrolase [Hyphomicrobiaceae bacterium]|nr:metal-dependent hydrolase [Hyphomicrobiaceae bacterium]